jgi:membrane associated rhomboid family serine protease
VTTQSEPIFNVPGVVLAIIAICALVLAGQTYLLTERDNDVFLYCFGFVPVRYSEPVPPCPLGPGAGIWSFVTYAFLHGNLTHLAMNSIWFLPFGSAVARRFGTLRTLGFFAATAAGGALMHLATHWGDARAVMIGASGAVSGFMAGAIRFAFQHGGPLGMFRPDDASAYRIPAAPLPSVLRDPRVVIFIAVWFGLNLVAGVAGVGAPGEIGQIAWEAHIGGFLTGLLLFRFFDPVPASTA